MIMPLMMSTCILMMGPVIMILILILILMMMMIIVIMIMIMIIIRSLAAIIMKAHHHFPFQIRAHHELLQSAEIRGSSARGRIEGREAKPFKSTTSCSCSCSCSTSSTRPSGSSSNGGIREIEVLVRSLGIVEEVRGCWRRPARVQVHV